MVLRVRTTFTLMHQACDWIARNVSRLFLGRGPIRSPLSHFWDFKVIVKNCFCFVFKVVYLSEGIKTNLTQSLWVDKSPVDKSHECKWFCKLSSNFQSLDELGSPWRGCSHPEFSQAWLLGRRRQSKTIQAVAHAPSHCQSDDCLISWFPLCVIIGTTRGFRQLEVQWSCIGMASFRTSEARQTTLLFIYIVCSHWYSLSRFSKLFPKLWLKYTKNWICDQLHYKNTCFTGCSQPQWKSECLALSIYVYSEVNATEFKIWFLPSKCSY